MNALKNLGGAVGADQRPALISLATPALRSMLTEALDKAWAYAKSTPNGVDDLAVQAAAAAVGHELKDPEEQSAIEEPAVGGEDIE